MYRHHPSTLVCPLTTSIQKGSKILRVHLPAGSYGLEESSDVMLDQVRAIDNRRFISKVGQVTGEASKKIKLNLGVIFDLE
jgi:mRNA interferase MazF